MVSWNFGRPSVYHSLLVFSSITFFGGTDAGNEIDIMLGLKIFLHNFSRYTCVFRLLGMTNSEHVAKKLKV